MAFIISCSARAPIDWIWYTYWSHPLANPYEYIHLQSPSNLLVKYPFPLIYSVNVGTLWGNSPSIVLWNIICPSVSNPLSYVAKLGKVHSEQLKVFVHIVPFLKKSYVFGISLLKSSPLITSCDNPSTKKLKTSFFRFASCFSGIG